jgi:hypothetical protein
MILKPPFRFRMKEVARPAQERGKQGSKASKSAQEREAKQGGQLVWK